MRSQHLVHIRCELPAPNALQLFRALAGHRRVQLISLMDHTPGQRQWTDVSHARTYYTGKGLERRQVRARDGARPCARPSTRAPPRLDDSLRAPPGIALATHDDTTPEHVEEAIKLGASMSEFPPRWPPPATRTARPQDHCRRPQRRAWRLTLRQRRGG